MTYEIRNATIRDAEIEYNKGMLTLWLQLDYGELQQGFGGYRLFNSNFDTAERSPAGFFIDRILTAVGVLKFSQLRGKTIRVALDGIGLRATIQGIGHIVKDEWFYPGREL